MPGLGFWYLLTPASAKDSCPRRGVQLIPPGKEEF